MLVFLVLHACSRGFLPVDVLWTRAAVDNPWVNIVFQLMGVDLVF